MKYYDSIIIGSGVNSLVAATMLGKKGKKVLVLESRNEIGGLSSKLKFGASSPRSGVLPKIAILNTPNKMIILIL